ncbi:hypothetical protein PybrP1_002031 [[Pythium] brassicae (nom. inval.)]|nr:hypothetical protein PybrP1_002031 [[Pythium] brassicae (nom. inval.)]
MQSTALEFGVINTLRTGHAVYDLMICMAVPAVIQAATTSGKDSLEVLRAAREALTELLLGKKYVIHSVETTEHRGRNGKFWRSGSDVRGNELLQKAILLYLSEHLTLDNENGRYELLERPRAKHKLIEHHLGGIEPEKRKRILALLQHKDESALPEVAKLGANPLPALNEWVKLGDGVEFMNETVSQDLDKAATVQETKVRFHFRSSARDGPERIDRFITKAFEFYRKTENRKFKDDTSRYMYVQSADRPEPGDTDDESKLSAPDHKRYALRDDKTFDNLFFHEKPQLLKLIDNFQHKTGKFAIKGFPNKLGLLLHGPPGTGKTSLIKAVAHHTKRHIVNISLGKIKTNQELMNAIFDLRYTVDGLDLPVNITFKDVVFVMEDIDCATSVVMSRDTTATTTAATTATETVTETATEADADAAQPESESEMETKPERDNNAKDTTDGDDSATAKLRSEPTAATNKDAEAAGSENLEVSESDEDDFDGGDDDDLFMGLGGDPANLFAAFLQAQTGAFGITSGGGGDFGPKKKGGFVASSNSSDKLNLAGVLNVLDGVIDCPGRIVIMTTNHPEKLDPALIRPGRISKKLHMGYMGGAEIQAMIEYYFSAALTPEQSERIHASVKVARRLSPALIEELCAEFDDVEDVLRKIASD